MAHAPEAPYIGAVTTPRTRDDTRLGADQRTALAAVIEFGSFDAAALHLHLTRLQ